MNWLRVLGKKEKDSVGKELSEEFGISNIPGEIIMQMFLFSGSFDENKIKKLGEKTQIERAGVYFAKVDEPSGKIRLSIEGSQIFRDDIKKNLFEINFDEAEEWMKGHELRIKTGIKGFIVLKNNGDFLGTGKASEEKIGNFIPKNRRLKEKG